MLRQALGDDKNGQHYIQTVPKHGYRFVANVVEISVADSVNENGGAALVQNQQAQTVRTNGIYNVQAQTIAEPPATTTPNQSVSPHTKKYGAVLAANLFVLLIGVVSLSFYYSQKNKSLARPPEINRCSIADKKRVGRSSARLFGRRHDHGLDSESLACRRLARDRPKVCDGV
jgi:hypothetical protein